METRSFSFQALDADRDGRRNERAQHWGRIFRPREGSICRHNFTGIACQECRWKVDYCFSIRRLVQPASLLNGRRWRGSSTVRRSIARTQFILRFGLFCVSLYIYIYCMPILHPTYAFTRARMCVIGQPFTSAYSEIIFKHLSLEIEIEINKKNDENCRIDTLSEEKTRRNLSFTTERFNKILSIFGNFKSILVLK